ncbi:hypothetical protein [Jeongeupia naejangsanensis]|uniref:Uncharacterized protein n=1 Tax=Jeongeupia naejangsanensis TaxID=613195 RepID=A0ABS2BF81_9NEIS|nr:hypothetical protein [Jeongeupia naejangsanensis]MBM3114266.1 hypothetical protein [Jeongeupia naejangsanensis]
MQTYYLFRRADGRKMIDTVVPSDADVIAECEADSWLRARKLLADLD